MRFFSFTLLILLLASCGKKDLKKDQLIKGNVRNNCTGTGFEDVEVKFIMNKQKAFGKTETTILTTRTDSNGDFSFTTDIYASSKYSYSISIPGYSNYNTEFYGTAQDIETDKLDNFHQFGVSATFKSCVLKLPTGVTVIATDTFSLNLRQPILHSYEPSRVWQTDYYPRFLNPGALYSPNWNNYPMGWWYITLDKTKSGIHSIVQDSIYMGMGATATYTIPW